MQVRLLALMATLVLLSWGVAEACKCAPEPPAREALAAADAGFVGTVVDQRTILHVDGVYTGPGIEYDMIVQRAWKGVAERRLSIRRLSRCAPAFRVGETSLVYAGHVGRHFVVFNCAWPKRLDRATADIVQLGTPMLTFPGEAQPVATSRPLSRWIRAHVLSGLGVYAFTYANRDWATPTWDMVLLTSVGALFAVAAAVSLLRRRWRAAAGFVAASVLTVAAGVVWAGHVFLRSDWSEPFLRW